MSEDEQNTAEIVELETSKEDESSEQEAQNPLLEAQMEVEKLKEQVLRALAEAENTRRRMKKELEDAKKYSVSSFAKQMLDVSDNFARALEAVPQDEAENATLKNLVTGVQAVERQLTSIFEQFGIKKVDPLGQPFDPHLHRVMMEQEDAAKPVGTVLQVFQPGYMIHDRLLREAMVVVSKGGPVAHKIDQEA